mgnify:CR=1 FL=1
MFNSLTPSLEDMPTGFDGRMQYPVICEACYQAMHHERGARSCPKSYAALAKSPVTYTVIDWRGIDTTVCRCCNSTSRSGRHAVEMRRK